MLALSGGLELLQAAGFENDEREGELFLAHRYDASGEQCARYVMSRLLQLEN